MSRLALLLACLPITGAAGVLHIRAADALYAEGQRAQEAGRQQEAIAKYESALEIEPTYLDAFTGISEACVALGRKEEAERALAKLLQIDPSLVKPRILLGDLLLETNQISRALPQFTAALAREPQNADALFGFATAAQALGLNDKAAAALIRGRAAHPDDKRFRKTLEPEEK